MKTLYNTFDMFGILNETGGLWSRHTFAEASEAWKYLREHDLNEKCDLSKHTVVPVKVTIEIGRVRDIQEEVNDVCQRATPKHDS